MKMVSQTMKMTVTSHQELEPMIAKDVQTQIQTVGQTRMKAGAQTTELMHLQQNLLNGSIQIMMDTETTSMASKQITALTEEDIPLQTDLVVLIRTATVGLTQTLVVQTESNHGSPIQMVLQMLSHSSLASGMILMKMVLEIIGQIFHGMKLE